MNNGCSNSVRNYGLSASAFTLVLFILLVIILGAFI